MATALPQFPAFSVFEDQASAGPRWRTWLAKFENLLCALDITTDARKKALLHYAVEEVRNIFDSFSEEKKGVGAVIGDNARPNEYAV